MTFQEATAHSFIKASPAEEPLVERPSATADPPEKLASATLDELALARLRAANRKTQEQVFRRFEKLVYGLCFRLLNHQADALDAMQDSFIQAFTQCQSLRNADAFGAWLRSIVVHRCFQTLRQRKQFVFLDSEESDALICKSNVGASKDTEAIDQLDLNRALQQLPDRSRVVLWLFSVEGYSHQELAELFKQSLSFSKSQVSRSMQALRAHLQSN
jgi:RNA polymerase sigma factor (sigma-70 family)